MSADLDARPRGHILTLDEAFPASEDAFWTNPCMHVGCGCGWSTLITFVRSEATDTDEKRVRMALDYAVRGHREEIPA